MKEKTAKKILKKLEALEETMNVILGASLLDKLTNKHIPDFESGGYVFNSKTNDTNIFQHTKKQPCCTYGRKRHNRT